jgi:hypothetical protein
MVLSFLSSAWERKLLKLRFITTKKAELSEECVQAELGRKRRGNKRGFILIPKFRMQRLKLCFITEMKAELSKEYFQAGAWEQE